MFRRTERGRTGQHNQNGFSLVEVVVAVGLLVLVLIAVLPELVVGVRATAGAKNLSQAKGVLQAQLETMRSMPYFVKASSDATSAQVLAGGVHVDLLDTYYKDTLQKTSTLAPTVVTTPAVCMSGATVRLPQAEWEGFVPSDSARCTTYEPSVGAFYRKVFPNISAPGLGVFTLVIDSAFLSIPKADSVPVSGSVSPPALVSPPAVYTSQTVGNDTPGSGLLGVWSTVVYRQSAALKPVTTYTQISQKRPAESSLLVDATVTAVRVVSQSPLGLLTLDAGVVTQAGARYTGSSVSVNANAASASLATGESVSGASATLSAPPSASPIIPPDKDPQWLFNDCQYVCIGKTSVSGASVSTSDGLPLSGLSPSAPVKVAALPVALHVHPAVPSVKYGGFWYNNSPETSGPGFDRGLSADLPMVSLLQSDSDPTVFDSKVQSNCVNSVVSETSNLFSVTGFLWADPVTNASPTVWSCVTARTAKVIMFPTVWAPDGIIHVTLDQSALWCKVQRAVAGEKRTTAANYTANVEYFNGTTYVPVPLPIGTVGPTVTQASLVDALATPSLLDATVGGPAGGPTFTLRHFIQSWRTITKGEVDTSQDRSTPEMIRAKVSGVVSIESQRTRSGDPGSVVSVTVGTFTCDAKDAR